MIPLDFLESFEDMNFKIQRDVYEYFNEFQDNIERSLESNKENLIQFTDKLGGEFINEIRFTACGHVTSVSPEKFIVLSLEVRNMKDIHSALEYFSHWELLQGETQECPECGQKSAREKRTKIGKWPKQLIIHLKRFQFEKGKFIKLNDGFKFQEKIKLAKDLKEEEDAEQKEVEKFKLDGMICHAGSVQYGHYVSLIRNRSSDETRLKNRQKPDHLWMHNFRSKTIESIENDQKGQWVLYNDDVMSQYNERHVPRDCFGEFENEENYSFEEFKGIKELDSKKSGKVKKLSEGKEKILKDLEIVKDVKGFGKTKESNNSNKSVSSGLMNGMNAYLLFYSLEKENENDSDEEQIKEVLNEVSDSEFGAKIQSDLDKELIFDNRNKILSSQIGNDFISKLLKTSLNSCFETPSNANLDVLFNSCRVAFNYFTDFYCQTVGKSSGCYNLLADSIINFLEIDKLLELKERYENRNAQSNFSRQNIQEFIKHFSLFILEHILNSINFDESKRNDNGLIMTLISSREDLYSIDGVFSEQSSMKVASGIELSAYKWFSQIIIQCINNLTPIAGSLTWNEKRILVTFSKICLSMLSLYQINATVFLVFLERICESAELVHALSRLGTPGLFVTLLPQLFEDINDNQLNAWICLKNYFKYVPEKYQKCKNIQEYYSKKLMTSDSNPKGRST